MSTRKERRKRKCTTCGRMAVDHFGPCGKKCQLSPLRYDEEDSVDDKPSDDDSKSQVLNELADQMSQLAASMQKLQLDMSDLQKKNSGVALQDAGMGPSKLLF